MNFAEPEDYQKVPIIIGYTKYGNTSSMRPYRLWERIIARLPMPTIPVHQAQLRRIEIDYGGFHVAVDADIPMDSLHRMLTVLKELDA